MNTINKSEKAKALKQSQRHQIVLGNEVVLSCNRIFSSLSTSFNYLFIYFSYKYDTYTITYTYDLVALFFPRV